MARITKYAPETIKKVLDYVRKGNKVTHTAKKFNLPYSTVQTWVSRSGQKAHQRRDKQGEIEITAIDQLTPRIYKATSDILDTLTSAVSAKSNARERKTITSNLALKDAGKFTTQDVKNLATALGIVFDKLDKTLKSNDPKGKTGGKILVMWDSPPVEEEKSDEHYPPVPMGEEHEE